MNVCFCVNTLGYAMGGVSTHIIDLIKQFSRREDIVKIVICCNGGELVDNVITIPKVQYYNIPFDTNNSSIQAIFIDFKKLYKIVKSEKIDIIHIHSQRILPIGYLLKITTGIPYLWTNHIDAIPNNRVFKVMCRLMRFPIISVSQELRNMMINIYRCNEKRVFVVNNGIDIESYTPLSSDEISELEKKFNIDRNKTPYVISLLSRVTYAKGHIILLKAIAKSIYKNKIKLIFAGHTYPNNEKYKQDLQLFADSQNIDLTFLDYSSPREVFGISDLFVLPSLYEGFPLVCLEALAMNCAVLRSRTPGWQEMQDYVGIFEKNDIDGACKMIDDAITNNFYPERTALGNSAVREYFTKEVCATKTFDIYSKLIK